MIKEKLTVIKVGGKIVEEEATLNQLLTDFSAIEGYKVLVHGVAVFIAGNDNLDSLFAQFRLAFEKFHPFRVIVSNDEGAYEVVVCSGTDFTTHQAAFFQNFGSYSSFTQAFFQENFIRFFQHFYLGETF